jgi:hypothetical protein
MRPRRVVSAKRPGVPDPLSAALDRPPHPRREPICCRFASKNDPQRSAPKAARGALVAGETRCARLDVTGLSTLPACGRGAHASCRRWLRAPSTDRMLRVTCKHARCVCVKGLLVVRPVRLRSSARAAGQLKYICMTIGNIKEQKRMLRGVLKRHSVSFSRSGHGHGNRQTKGPGDFSRGTLRHIS